MEQYLTFYWYVSWFALPRIVILTKHLKNLTINKKIKQYYLKSGIETKRKHWFIGKITLMLRD